MAHTLMLDCSSGIAGDMLVAALIDLGASRTGLMACLESLKTAGAGDFDVRISRVSKHGIDACDFDVVLDEDHNNHDHDMAWLHPEPEAHAEHDHHEHDHGHGHHHEHAHGHEHRGLADILPIIEKADLSRRGRQIAKRTFKILSEGEAKAHGTEPDKVHFHEVGAIDSIVDVIAAAFCLDNLDIERVIVSELAEGSGTIRCAHGMMPIPVPAVTAICEANGIALSLTGIRGELVTPTGAALVAAIRTDEEAPSPIRILRTGTGAGKRDYACAGIVRAMLLEGDLPAWSATRSDKKAAPSSEGQIVKLECDLDDCTGEALGAVMDELLAAGAREVHYLPIFTKKGRPAWQLQVICMPEDVSRLEAIVFRDTTTIGIRRQRMERSVLERRAVELATPLGSLAAKEVVLPDGSLRRYPEHDDVLRLAREKGLGLQDAWQIALATCAQGEKAGRRKS